MLLAQFFILPLHVAQSYGPFTEGGGDVAIYADVARYVTDNHMPIWGLADAGRRIAALFDLTRGSAGDNLETLATFDPARGNPPVANSQVYRVSLVQRYPSLIASPIAQWAFLPGQTTYVYFYAALAFQYAVLIMAATAFLARYGRLAAIAGAATLLASHGLVSVSYNVYFSQALSLMLCALLLAVLPSVRLLSGAGLRTVGVILLLLLCGYFHFLSLIAPLLLLKVKEVGCDLRLGWRGLRAFLWSGGSTRRLPVSSLRSGWPTVLQGIALAPVALIATVWALASLSVQLTYLGVLVWQFLGRAGSLVSFLVPAQPSQQGPGTMTLIDWRQVAVSSFFGDAVPIGSSEWLSFLFGSVSQQHYPPFVLEPPTVVEQAITLANGLGFALLAAGALGVLLAALSKRAIAPAGGGKLLDPSRDRYALACYLAGLVGIVLHLGVAQSSMYVQAKGAQDVLVLLYVLVLGVPLAVLSGGRLPAYRPLVSAYGLLLVAFVGALLVPRVYFANRLAHEEDRSTILDGSFYAEAARIRSSDPDAFVLAEPRNSSDTYLISQPFFGARVVATRHMVLTRSQVTVRDGRYVGANVDSTLNALDFVRPDDLPHLWTLATDPGDQGDCRVLFFWQCSTGAWHAERLIDVQQPELVLAGSQYEKYSQRAARSSEPRDVGWFSYVNNGGVAVALPGCDQAQTISIGVKPLDPSSLDSLGAAIDAWVTAHPRGVLAPPRVADNAVVFDLQVDPHPEPELVPLLDQTGEFLVNVQIDGKELKEDHTQLSAPESAHPSDSIQVAWVGVENPEPDDWVAMFPANGRDQDRVEFVFTGGGQAGTINLPVPATLTPGHYELRLYHHGTWQMLAVTDLRVIP